MHKRAEASSKLVVLLLVVLLAAACGRRTTPSPSPAAVSPTQAPASPTPTATPIPASPTPAPTATPIPPTPPPATEAPTPTATPSPVVGTVSDVLRVREGPGTGYPILGVLQPGTQVTLLARSPDLQWFQIAYPPDSDGRGWLSGEFLQVQGSPDQLPVAEAPPPPAPTATLAASPAITPTLAASPAITPTTPVVTGTLSTTGTLSAVVATQDGVLRVRGGPGTGYPILGNLQPGTQVTLLARSPDGAWFEIAYPPGSDGRGWLAGEFLQVQGSPEGLPVAEAPVTPTPVATVAATPTLTTAEACAPIPGEQYGLLAITSAPTDRPAAVHADLNLALRGYAPVDVPKALIDLSGSSDPHAPQLRGLFADRRIPTITGTYQVYGWEWSTNTRGALIESPQVTLLGLGAATGEIIDTPGNGGDLAEGYVALVLYATPERITLKYTRDDNVVAGYTVHIEKVCVEPTLLALYQKLDGDGRIALPALRAGQPLGRATGSEIDVAVRDRGMFMDPRSRKDWWSGQ